MDRKAVLISILFANCWLGIHQALGADQEGFSPGELIQQQNQDLAEALYKDVMNKHADREALKEFDEQVCKLHGELDMAMGRRDQFPDNPKFQKAFEDREAQLEALLVQNATGYSQFYRAYERACLREKIIPMEPAVPKDYGKLGFLPAEMLVHIVKYLDYESLKNLMVTNRTFKALGEDPQVQNGLKVREVYGLLSGISRLEPAQLYTAVSLDEINAAAKKDREPGYLPMIHKAYGIRLREFLGGIEVGESRENRIRHGINLMHSMETASSTVIFSAWSAAWSAAGSDAGSVTGDTLISEAYSVALDAAREVLATSQNLSHQEKGRLAYRVAEVTALLYLLKFALDDPSNGFEGIFSKVYRARDGVLKIEDLPKDLSISIWESQKAWDVFYAQHFANPMQDPLAFLTPYLDEINKIRLSLNPRPKLPSPSL